MDGGWTMDCPGLDKIAIQPGWGLGGGGGNSAYEGDTDARRLA